MNYRHIALALTMQVLILSAFGQKSIDALATSYSEDFDALPTSGTSAISGLETGWIIEKNDANATVSTADDGNTNTPAHLFSYGTGTNADRALGALNDGDSTFVAGWVFENNTGETIYKAHIKCTGEQWRVGSPGGLINTTSFAYSIATSITDLNSGPFTNETALNFQSPIAYVIIDGTFSTDGNDAANREEFDYILHFPSGIANGDDVALRWSFPTATNSANVHGLAIDDVSVAFFGKQWYLETGETDVTAKVNWTPYSSGLAITATPDNDTFDGTFDSDNYEFHISTNSTVADGSTASTNFAITGDGSNLIIDENITFEVEDAGIQYNFSVQMLANSTWNTKINNNFNFNGSSDPHNVVFDSIYSGATVKYLHTNTASFTIPQAYYQNLTIGTGGGTQTSHNFTWRANTYVAGTLLYELTTDRTGESPTPTLHFFGGGTAQISVPNFTGNGVFPDIVVQSGTTLQLGTVSNDSLVHTSDFTNNGTVNIASGEQLNITTGVLDNDGTINVADDGSLVQGTGSTLTGSGTFNVTRAKPNGQANGLYNFWSTPVTSTFMSEFSASRKYKLEAPGSSTSDWSAVSNATQLEVGRGYALTGVSSITFTGTANNGDLTFTATHDGTGNDNFNVVGNPYPSAINAKDFLDANSAILDGHIALFNHNDALEYTVGNQQIVINNMGATVAGSTDNDQTIANTYIASGQGFYVQVTDNAGGTVNFTNAMRGGDNSDFKNNEEQEILAKFFIQLVDNDTRYNTLFGMVSNTSMKYDRGWDAGTSTGNAFGIHTMDITGKPLCIQSIPAVDKTTAIPLGVSLAHGGYYQLHLDPTKYQDFGETQPLLLDAETGTLVKALDEDLEFYSDQAKYYNDRFFIVFGKTSFATNIVGQTERNNQNWFHVVNDIPTLYSLHPEPATGITIWDVSGKKVATVNGVTHKNELPALQGKHGSYIIGISYKNGQTDRIKIVL